MLNPIFIPASLFLKDNGDVHPSFISSSHDNLGLGLITRIQRFCTFK